MVWLVEKRVVRRVLDLGFERVEIPVRVKFEFEVEGGSLVPGSLSFETLYNRHAIKRRYPQLNQGSLDQAIEKTVGQEIRRYFKKHGFIDTNSPVEDFH